MPKMNVSDIDLKFLEEVVIPLGKDFLDTSGIKYPSDEDDYVFLRAIYMGLYLLNLGDFFYMGSREFLDMYDGDLWRKCFDYNRTWSLYVKKDVEEVEIPGGGSK